MGERLGHVIDVTDTDPNARAYRNRDELYPHTDIEDIVAFLCLRPARVGGLSRFVSAPAVHNEILARRSDLLEILYRGFHYHRFGEEPPGEPPITRHRVPVFSERDGLVSCRYVRQYIEIAAQESGVPLSPAEVEALDLVDAIARREDVGIEVRLEAGEAAIMNNFTVMHARTAFESDPDPTKRRHLLRLWLLADPPRPVVPEVMMHDGEMSGVGVVPQTGRTPSYAHSATRH
jgi:alpha-ketoglutarate-dependent taurine dioxygenase